MGRYVNNLTTQKAVELRKELHVYMYKVMSSQGQSLRNEQNIQ